MKYFKVITYILMTCLATACATVIGGTKSTAETSGGGVGPATISDANATLQNDKFNSLTIGGDLNAQKITIINDLNIESNATLYKISVRDDTKIGGNLYASDCTFKDAANIHGNVSSSNSYFGNGLNVDGSKIELANGTKVNGNLQINSLEVASVTLDHSLVKGNIVFATPGGLVITKNKGQLKGTIQNGTLKSQ